MIHDKFKLQNYVPPFQSNHVTIADGNSLSLKAVGFIFQSSLSVDNVLYVTQLFVNLLFIGRLTNLGYHVNFTPNSCIVQDPRTKVPIRIGHKKGGLYELEYLHVSVVTAMASSPDLSSFRLSSESSMFYS